MCLLIEKDPGSFQTLQYIYDQARILKLLERLDLAEVEALRADPELIAAAKQKDVPSLGIHLMSWLEERRARLVPGEFLATELLDARRADGYFTTFKYPGLLSAAARGNPDAAIAFWKSDLSAFEPENPEVPLRKNHYLGDMIEGVTMADPAKAWDFIRSLDAATRTPEVVRCYFSALPAGTDWSLAVAQLESCGPLQSGNELSISTISLATSWMKDDPDGATRWLDSINDSLVEIRGNHNEMSSGSPRLEARASVYAAAMDSWFYTDPLEAIEFLDRWQPADTSKVQVLREIIGESSPAFHSRLVDLLDSPQERAELVIAVAHDSNERADIDRLLAMGGLSSETQEELKEIRGSIAR
jgi:hypothetical protein